MNSKKRLVKEGDQYWDPESGYIYNSEGELIARDAVYRPTEKPKINFNDYEIDDGYTKEKEGYGPKEYEYKGPTFLEGSTIAQLNQKIDNLAIIDWNAAGEMVIENRKKQNKFEYVSWSTQEFDLPTRATTGSAGYDFHSPKDVIINPGETVKFSLEVKVQLKDWTFLMIVPRSSLGFKGANHVTLTNTTGIIDQDYYNNPKNEGVIEVKLHNFGTEPYIIKQNDRIVQGIFVHYDITCDDNVDSVRSGGFGSTGN